MKKRIALGLRAQRLMAAGLAQVARATDTTMGPNAHNVFIQQRHRPVYTTKDGFTVALVAQNARHPVVQMGAQIAYKAAKMVVDLVGDGTTSVLSVADATVREGLRRHMGNNMMRMCREITDALRVVEGALFALETMPTPKVMEEVALAASNGSEQIALLVSQAVAETGPDSAMLVEPGPHGQYRLDITDGFTVDEGYLTPASLTNKERLRCELANPALIMWRGELADVSELQPLVTQAVDRECPVVVFVQAADEKVIASFNRAVRDGRINGVLVKAPGEGADAVDEWYKTLGAWSGGHPTDTPTLKYDKSGVFVLGLAERALVEENRTTIFAGKGSGQRRETRLTTLRELLEQVPEPDRQAEVQRQISYLSGGAAIVKVPESTDSGLKQCRQLIEDAFQAVRVAGDGVVPGGGVVYAKVADVVRQIPTVGAQVLAYGIDEPVRVLAGNAGIPASRALAQARIGKPVASEGTIYDPSGVVATVIYTAASAAVSILSTSCAITDIVRQQPIQMKRPKPKTRRPR